MDEVYSAGKDIQKEIATGASVGSRFDKTQEFYVLKYKDAIESDIKYEKVAVIGLSSLAI